MGIFGKSWTRKKGLARQARKSSFCIPTAVLCKIANIFYFRSKIVIVTIYLIERITIEDIFSMAFGVVWFCLGMLVILGKVNTIRKYQRKHIINNRILLKFSITNNQTFNFLSVITGSYIFILHIARSSIFISMYS